MTAKPVDDFRRARHLGRDPERAAAAASAAADLAAQGSGFNRAADAARAAWVGREIQGVKNLHAERRSPHPWLSGHALATGVFLLDSVAMFGATFCNGPTF